MALPESDLSNALAKTPAGALTLKSGRELAAFSAWRSAAVSPVAE